MNNPTSIVSSGVPHPPKRWLIALTGPGRAGKSTAASILCQWAWASGRVPWCGALGDGVKEELSTMSGVPVEVQEKDREKWRGIWQLWATEVRRTYSHREWWLEKWDRKVQEGIKGGASILIIPDIRFVNEAEWIRRWARNRMIPSTVICIQPGLTRWLRGKPWKGWRSHSSEKEWSRILVDGTITNSGNLHQLRVEVESMVIAFMERTIVCQEQ